MRSLSFECLGVPQPKGSLTRMPHGGMVEAGTRASRERKAAWRSDLRAAALSAIGDEPLMLGAIRLSIHLALPHPQLPRYKQGWWAHVKKPDIDKLARACLDPLTGVVWKDDAQVFALTVIKAYAWDGRPSGHFTIDELDWDELKRLAQFESAIRQELAHD